MGQTSVWDWLVIRVLLQIAGYTFKHVIKNTSDYLRGGGNMLWWVAGVSGVMGIIGSFVFTGGGEKMYKEGIKKVRITLDSVPNEGVAHSVSKHG